MEEIKESPEVYSENNRSSLQSQFQSFNSYSLDHCVEELNWFMDNFAIEKMNSLSLAFTFTLWRKKLFTRLEQEIELESNYSDKFKKIKEFSNEIDKTHFHPFFKKFPRIICTSLKGTDKGNSFLKEIITCDSLLFAYINWTISIEYLADLFSRFELYTGESIQANMLKFFYLSAKLNEIIDSKGNTKISLDFMSEYLVFNIFDYTKSNINSKIPNKKDLWSIGGILGNSVVNKIIEPYKFNFEKKKKAKLMNKLLHSTIKINSVSNEIEILLESLFLVKNEDDYNIIIKGFMFIT